jgi:hypothetical protein
MRPKFLTGAPRDRPARRHPLRDWQIQTILPASPMIAGPRKLAIASTVEAQ